MKIAQKFDALGKLRPIIRMAAADINIYNRTAQGVRVMRVSPDSKVIALARVDKEMDDETSEP